ncbi:MAG: hypothetical protein ACRDRV_08315 [Pseudonocardiaceae bacterium]
MLLYCGSDADEFTDEHEGWVAGRFRDGSLSDIWTDVHGCADQTVTAYLPRCECGWIGTAVPATSGGYNAAERQWRSRHLPEVVATRPAPRLLPEPACVQGSFVPER